MAGDYFADFDLAGEDIHLSAPPPPDWEVDTLPAPVRPSVDLWPPKLPLEIALCETPEEQYVTASRFGLTRPEFDKLALISEFRRAVAESGVAIRESGYSFKIKCRAIAEDFLGDLDRSLHDVQVGLSTKLDIFKIVTKLGELEPKAKKEDGPNANVPTVNIQINC